MYLNLGNIIKEQRLKRNMTQETLASALGVTSQAVSRWESGSSYPDMELISPIANFFGITIDELFGYHNNRDEVINGIINKIKSFNIKARLDTDWIDECVNILKDGLLEFPKNDLLLIELAEVYSEAGYRKFKEHSYYDKDGIRKHNYFEHNKNNYWKESIKICENLLDETRNTHIKTRAYSLLVTLNKNIGNFTKSVKYANKMNSIEYSKELMLIKATDHIEQNKYIGNYLLTQAAEMSHQIVKSLMNNLNNHKDDFAIKKIKGAIDLFYLICDDGNFGIYNGELIKLYLYLSRLEYEKGYQDDAFASLDNALKHAKALESLKVGEHKLTAPLVSEVTFTVDKEIKCVKDLPADFPWYQLPPHKEVTDIMKQDPRFIAFVNKTLC